MLYMALSSVSLSDRHDEIIWRWRANGQYTAASAYDCQFKGAYTFFPTTEVWKVFRVKVQILCMVNSVQ
jgi:hypothetical protein